MLYAFVLFCAKACPIGGIVFPLRFPKSRVWGLARKVLRYGQGVGFVHERDTPQSDECRLIACNRAF